MVEPSYLDIFRSKELDKRVNEGLEALRSCNICPRECGIDRIEDEVGFCMIGRDAVVSSFGPHIGEEPELVGVKGSGTVFFSGCNLGCLYCQNHGISQGLSGSRMGSDELAEVFLKVKEAGCHNLNLVSPSHVVPQILDALQKACMDGFDLPIVYNTGGYDSLKMLKLLDGIVDIYMPDMKYSDPIEGEKLSMVRNYPKFNYQAVKEMHRQVGDLVIGDDGLAKRGLLVRHLVLPNGKAGTAKVMKFLSQEISRNTYVNILDQYRPEYNAMGCGGMGRSISKGEYEEAVNTAKEAGIQRLLQV